MLNQADDTGASFSVSGQGKLLRAFALSCWDVERNYKVYSNEVKVIVEHLILLDTCTGSTLLPASRDCSGLWSVTKKKMVTLDIL